MAIHLRYRKDRKRWGIAGYHHSKRFFKFQWVTKEEAEKALHLLQVELDSTPEGLSSPGIPIILGKLFTAYLAESKAKGRSTWRVKGLYWGWQKHIIPFFGEDKTVADITRKDIENFVGHHKARGEVKNNTIWHYVTDLRAALNWAVKEDIIPSNPVNKADLSLIKNRKFVKMPLDPRLVDKAAEALEGQDRIYFDCLRWTGLRKDEANRLRWTDLELDREPGLMMVPGTKTEDSASVLPLCPALTKVLQALKTVSEGCQWVFPGQSGKTEGKKVYGRTRMFERIYSKTGIKLVPKDLRDYFASEVSSKVDDPNVIMRLLRHTNLNTTTKYLRVVETRMAAAVKGLGE